MYRLYLEWDKRPAVLYMERKDGGVRAGFYIHDKSSKWRSANGLQLYCEAHELTEEDWREGFQYWAIDPVPEYEDYDVHNIYTEPDYDDHWWLNE